MFTPSPIEAITDPTQSTNNRSFSYDIKVLAARLIEAPGAPTVNDDEYDGIALGTIWIDTVNQVAYINLSNEPGNALWVAFAGDSMIATQETTEKIYFEMKDVVELLLRIVELLEVQEENKDA